MANIQITQPEFKPAASPLSDVTERAGDFQLSAMPAPPAHGRAPAPPQLPTPPAAGPSQSQQVFDAIAQAAPRIGEALASIQKERRSQASTEIATQLSTMTDEQAQKYYDDNKSTRSSAFVTELNKLYGERAARRDKETINQGLLSGDISLDNTSIQNVVGQQSQKTLSQFNDPHFKQGYASIMADQLPVWQNQEATYRAEQLKTERAQNVYQTMIATIDDGSKSGLKPDAINESVRALYDRFGPGTGLNMSHKDLDTVTLQAAQYAAEKGQTDVVSALLNTDRGDTPALSKIAGRADDVQRITDAAKRNAEELFQKQHFNAMVGMFTDAGAGKLPQGWENDPKYRGIIDSTGMSPVQVASLIGANTSKQEELLKQAQRAAAEAQDGKIQEGIQLQAGLAMAQGQGSLITGATYTSPITGKSVQISAEQVRQTGLDLAMKQATVTTANGQVDPEKTVQNQLNIVAKNGIVYKPWADQMQMGAYSMSATGPSSPALKQGYTLWSYMSRNPGLQGLANQHAGQYASDIYSAIQFVQQNMVGGDFDQAAKIVTANKANLDYSQSGNAARKSQIEQKAKDTVSSLNGGFLGMFGADVKNTGQVQTDLARRANMYAALTGVNADQALDLAKKNIEKSYKVVRGVAINMDDVNIPQNFPLAADFAAHRYAQKYGAEEGVKEGDLALFPMGGKNNVFWLVNRNTGLPVENLNAQDEGGVPYASFPNGSLGNLAAARTASVQAQATAQADAAQAGRATKDINGVATPGSDNPNIREWVQSQDTGLLQSTSQSITSGKATGDNSTLLQLIHEELQRRGNH